MLYYNYVVVFIKHSILNKKCMKSGYNLLAVQMSFLTFHLFWYCKKQIYTFVKKHLLADQIIKLFGELLLVTIDSDYVKVITL